MPLRSSLALLVAVAALVAVGCGREEPLAPVGQEYFETVEQIRREREARLRRPDGWLTLVGLYWLEPGTNTIGSAPRNDVVLPEPAPERVGVLRLEDGAVTAVVDAGVRVEHEGEPVTTLPLVPDSAGEPTVFELGTLSLYVIERGDRLGVRVKDREAETLARFSGLDFYPIDPAWRLAGRLRRDPEAQTIDVPNVLGTVETLPSPGLVELEWRGETVSLQPIDEGDAYFFVFGDATNGAETYGGGRFLYTEPADETGRVIVDFNLAYNPPCVFTPFATCPLAPPQNRLPFPVTAGEKVYGKGH